MRVGSRVGRMHVIQQGVGSEERGGGPLIYWRLGGGGQLFQVCEDCFWGILHSVNKSNSVKLI